MTAEMYFWAMAMLAVPLAMLHLKERDYGAAVSCVTMLWFMWWMVPIMEALCATNPIGAAIAHVPMIVALAGQSVCLMHRSRAAS